MTEFITVKEFARTFRVSVPRAYALLDEARIPYIRLSSNRIRIPRIEFEHWMESQLTHRKPTEEVPLDLDAE